MKSNLFQSETDTIESSPYSGFRDPYTTMFFKGVPEFVQVSVVAAIHGTREELEGNIQRVATILEVHAHAPEYLQNLTP